MVGCGKEPTDEKLLREEVARLRLENAVEFTGFIPLKKAFEYIQNADVCVSPYYPTFVLNSTSPTKLIEYMAMGKATVVTDHPEQRLVISKSQAGICVPYDENSFAQAVIKLLKNPQMRKKMGERGKHFVKKHRTYEVIGDIVEEQYQKMMYVKNQNT